MESPGQSGTSGPASGGATAGRGRRGPRHGRLIATAVALMTACCAAPRRDAVPPGLAVAGPAIDVANQSEYRAIDPAVIRHLEAGPPPGGGAVTAGRPRRLQVLALSGGGKYGAYAVGVLNGWTATGRRPTFDIVTGVSTGALVSTFAFLGPQYDDHLRALYTTLTTRDVVRRRPLYGLLGADAAYSSAPLARLIDAEVTDRLLAEVGAAHAARRRLFVATTNLDTARPVVWDMGA